ncbi:hypothetical protein FOL47_006685 [Perkinsus chesapeaki]|uniref:Uncharacterized protein n=1 Tax=Perkinsus chesapeaki TaxID=330153 RepID=A0A7J6LQ12_PERCH|nr:hypothetical protein FOL47_006685 [Perkinsus chesapeaki]
MIKEEEEGPPHELALLQADEVVRKALLKHKSTFTPTVEWFAQYMPREGMTMTAADLLASGRVAECFEVMVDYAEEQVGGFLHRVNRSHWTDQVAEKLQEDEKLSVLLLGLPGRPLKHDDMAMELHLLWARMRDCVAEEFKDVGAAVWKRQSIETDVALIMETSRVSKQEPRRNSRKCSVMLSVRSPKVFDTGEFCTSLSSNRTRSSREHLFIQRSSLIEPGSPT